MTVDRLDDTTALVRLQDRVGGLIVERRGDVPVLSIGGAEFCNVTGTYDLWVDGELRQPDMSARDVAEWLGAK